jgi:exopolysaccharide production protein ExoY
VTNARQKEMAYAHVQHSNPVFPVEAQFSYRPTDLRLIVQYLVNVIFALPLLVFLAPGMLVAAIVIMLQDGGPAIYRHKRIGRNGVEFDCLKFRSMHVDSAARLARLLAQDPFARQEWERDFKLKNDPRITPLGGFIRKSSIDELPQLFNVLRGEMSLVGPRPIVRDEISRYGRYFQYYCAVRPGVTGLWQVSGRSDISYTRRVAIDTTYVRRQSLALDLWILLQTPAAVFLSRGSY